MTSMLSEPKAYRVVADPRFGIDGNWWTGVVLQMAFNAVAGRDQPTH